MVLRERELLSRSSQTRYFENLDLAKIICMTMENMNTVPTMPFIGDNVQFQGKTRSFVSCDPLRNMDLSAWSRSGPSGGTNPTPKPTSGPNNSGDAPICDFDLENRTLDCSKRNFGDDDLEKMLNRLVMTHAYPVKVTPQVHRQVKKEAVWRGNFDNNPTLRNRETFLKVLSEFTFTAEVKARNLGMPLSRNMITGVMALCKDPNCSQVATFV